MTEAEPTSRDAVERWIAAHTVDPFADVREASVAHRVEHGWGCTVYPTSSGPVLAVLAAAVGARRILEIGTGLGYSALCLSSAGAHVHTLERDAVHAELARQHVARHGAAGLVEIQVGTALELLPALEGPYDLLFCDADPKGYPALLDHVVRLLRPHGVAVSANLFLGQFDASIPHIEHLATYRNRLLEDDRMRTAFVPGGLAISVRSG